MGKEDKNIGRLIQERYRLDALLGRGGFGSVYRGWDSQIGRDVAVKLLDVANGSRSAQQTAELRERFRREAMAAGRISHRGVVTIYDFGIPDDGGEAYLVMELLEGHDLSRQLRDNGPMAPDRIKRLFIPMLEALGKGHDLGIVHKDIKPQNIFFCHPDTNSESFCLVDFGVARVVHEDKLTMTGLIVGTPQYMAPEYITDTLVTPALDVYQMALILVELVTGAPAVPPGESFVKSCNRHFTGDLNIPDQLLEGDFGRMLQMALRPNATERLPHAARFAEMFADIDPSTIVIDSQATMVFMRNDAPADTLASEPPMFRPMKPAQVSAELERLEQGSDAFAQTHNTPVATLQPVEAPVEVPVMAGSLAAEPAPPPVSSEPIEAPVPAAVSETSHPVQFDTASADMPQPPSEFPTVAVIGVAIALLVGGTAAAIAFTSGPSETEAETHTAAQITAVPIENAMDPPDEPAPAAKMTMITSEPSGARIIVDGKVVGTTPGEVAMDSSDAAELHLEGYEIALVALEPNLETIQLTRSPSDRAAPSKATATAVKTQPSKVVPKPFVPEEPESGSGSETVEKVEPAKFESTRKPDKPARYDKPEVDIAP